jgi:hypothetical protein
MRNHSTKPVLAAPEASHGDNPPGPRLAPGFPQRIAPGRLPAPHRRFHAAGREESPPPPVRHPRHPPPGRLLRCGVRRCGGAARFVASPGVEKARLSVEQSPVHEPPPQLRPVFQQAVAIGIEQQHRRLPGQFRQRAGWDAADAGGQLAGGALHADRDSPAFAAVAHDRHYP